MRKLITLLIFCGLFSVGIFAQTTAFTYQGSLKDGASPANGNYDLEFKLFDAVSAGSQQGSTLQRLNVAVANGIFTVALDFGAPVLPGADRFLYIAVRTAGGGAFTPLTPRQQVNSAPYAVRSLNAATADSVTTGGIPAGSGNYIQNTTSPQAASNFNISNDGFINGSGGVGTSNNTFLGSPARFTVVQQQPGQWAGHFGTNNFAAGLSYGLLLDAGTNSADDAFRIRNQSGTSQFFSVKGNGFVGLGTANPNSHFHLQANAPQGLAFQMENTDTAKRLYIGNYGTIGGGNHWPGLDSANTSFLYAENPLIFTTPGGIYFSGSTMAEHMRITPGGNVGIGTTSPGNRLHVNSTVPNSFAARIQTNGLATGTSYGLAISAGTDARDNALQISNQATDSLMQVRGNGNVGIGTIDPIARLDVKNTTSFVNVARFTVDPGSRSYGVFIQAGSSANFTDYALDVQTLDGERALYVDGNGIVTVSNLSVVHLSNVGTSSACFSGQLLARCSASLRYKTNVRDYRFGLSLVKQFSPILFDWKKNGARDMGLAAEDVERIDPLLVTYNDKGEVEGVKYDRIGVVLINAVKEQQAQIEAQQTQNDELRKQVDALKAAVCSIKTDAEICKTKEK